MESAHLISTISQKAMIIIDGKLLLVHGTEEWWELPGGRVNEDETDLESALKREIKEELSMEIEILKINTAYLYKSRDNQSKFVLVYECRLQGKKDAIKLQQDEIYGWNLFTKEEIRDLKQIAGNSKQALNLYSQN